MNNKNIRKNLEKACKSLYDDLPKLISNRTHERTIASHLAHYLESLFQGWDVDTEYNREGENGKSKQSTSGELLLPDIIIHKRNFKDGPNLAAIQIKGFWNKEDRSKDEADLRKLQNNYSYHFLCRIELNPKVFEIIEIK